MKARAVLPFVCGVLFALGLGLSGMTQPAKVTAFLDVTGAWDPSLLLVMGGALAVDAVLFRLILRRSQPLLDTQFHLPTQTRVDGKLVVGAVLFGAGWGLSGYCPGPAVVGAAALTPGNLAFVAFMLVGMGGFRWWERRGSAWARVRAQGTGAACA